MGSLKDESFESEEEKRDEMLAKILGITYQELQQTEWNLNESKDNDGNVNNLLVEFNKNSPENILEKIIELDKNNTVWLNPNALENYQELDEEELGGEG
jgi:hypothetical protein